MLQEPYNLFIAGVGGQGNVLLSSLIAEAAVQSGFSVAVGNTFGVSQRGGAVHSSVRLGKPGRVLPPLVPRGAVQVILGLEPLEALRVFKTYGSGQTRVLTNLHPNLPLGVLKGTAVYPAVEDLQKELTELADVSITVEASPVLEELGNPLALNVVMLGALAATGWLPLERHLLREVMAAHFCRSKLSQLNFQAFTGGEALIKGGA